MKSKFILMFLVLFAPSLSFAQQLCNIRVNVTGGWTKPAILAVSKKHATFSDGTAHITDTIENNGVVNLEISFQDTLAHYWWQYPVYIQAGQLDVHIINTDKDPIPTQRGKLIVDGPKLSVEYNELYNAIMDANQKVYALKLKLHETRNNDTVSLKNQLKLSINECYGVPRNYVRKNPTSLLNIEVLKMMGSGDPTIEHPMQELADLFHSLPEDRQNSEEGQRYLAKLQQMRMNSIMQE